MGVGKAIHYLGSAFLFIAMVLAIVVCISAPVTDTISFVSLNLPQGDAKFGVFGYCSRPANGDWSCSDSSIGYNPAKVIEDISTVDFSNARSDTVEALTRVLVLHPVGAAVLFIAFLLSLAAGSTIISILAMLVAAAAFIINAVALIIDFVAFTLLGNEINDHSSGDASYGPAAWLALVVAILALISTIVMLVTCCAGRRQKKRESRHVKNSYGETGYGEHGAAY